MKAHIGVDAESGLVHTVFAESGYRGAHKRANAKPGVTWHIAVRPSDRSRLAVGARLGAILDKTETLKASVLRTALAGCCDRRVVPVKTARTG